MVNHGDLAVTPVFLSRNAETIQFAGGARGMTDEEHLCFI
ncbi:Hypothetical protein ETEE_0324 [Edwardsiella anguillarum ET080813]|uniref:Uncharacterized protein n=1 Tax=Edwardsiella anguillarum ET080813 TaxID=667120 RepID=A0A076LIT3_9GAMM|nr:Hypothetical protein ETEE_0324 [Edwardsiella anguillarum ET080813]